MGNPLRSAIRETVSDSGAAHANLWAALFLSAIGKRVPHFRQPAPDVRCAHSFFLSRPACNSLIDVSVC
jgi:hypothetical protein